MPFYCYTCYDCQDSTAKLWQSVAAQRVAPACAKCSTPMERDWHAEHAPTGFSVGSVFPYTTTHITGQPIEIKSESHLKSLCKQHGVRHRPDAAFIENDSGRGMPGSWN